MHRKFKFIFMIVLLYIGPQCSKSRKQPQEATQAQESKQTQSATTEASKPIANPDNMLNLVGDVKQACSAYNECSPKLDNSFQKINAEACKIIQATDSEDLADLYASDIPTLIMFELNEQKKDQAQDSSKGLGLVNLDNAQSGRDKAVAESKVVASVGAGLAVLVGVVAVSYLAKKTLVSFAEASRLLVINNELLGKIEASRNWRENPLREGDLAPARTSSVPRQRNRGQFVSRKDGGALSVELGDRIRANEAMAKNLKTKAYSSAAIALLATVATVGAATYGINNMLSLASDVPSCDEQLLQTLEPYAQKMQNH